MLFGKENRVSYTFLTENMEESPVKFTIPNEQLIKGYKIAKEKGLEMVGIFHSHPNSAAFPSDKDRKFMEINPVAWIIYSGINKDFRAFVLEQEIKEIKISKD